MKSNNHTMMVFTLASLNPDITAIYGQESRKAKLSVLGWREGKLNHRVV